LKLVSAFLVFEPIGARRSGAEFEKLDKHFGLALENAEVSPFRYSWGELWPVYFFAMHMFDG